MYLDSFLRYLEFEKRYSKHTVHAYERDLKQFLSYYESTFQSTLLKEVNHQVIRSWMVSLSDQDLNPRSINRKLASVRSFFKYLLSRGEIKENPTIRTKSLKTSKRLPSFVRENEMEQLLDSTQVKTFENIRDLIILELLYGTGIRLSELINLKKSDVDLKNNTIKVLGKRNKERIIPINEFLVGLISDYLEKKDLEIETETDYLIVNNNRKKAYPMFVQRIVSKYLSQTGAENPSPHVLRHSYATHLLNQGADLNAVKELLGHSSLAATQVYTHNSIEKLKNVFEKAHPKA